MGWKHVQGSGAQASSGSSPTLTATFSGAVAAGDLIVVSGVWYATTSGTPTVADSVNGVNYTYKGPTVVNGTDNLGTWEYVTPKGALPGTFTITFTVPGTGRLSRDDDRRIQLRHRGHLLDRQQRYKHPSSGKLDVPGLRPVGLRHGSGLRRRSPQRERNSVSRIRIHPGLQRPDHPRPVLRHRFRVPASPKRATSTPRCPARGPPWSLSTA